MERGRLSIAYLIDSFVPFLAADSDLDGLLHEASRDNDTVKLMGHPARCLNDLRRHDQTWLPKMISRSCDGLQ